MNPSERRVTRTLLIGAGVVVAMASLFWAMGREVGAYLLGVAFGFAVCGVIFAVQRRKQQRPG